MDKRIKERLIELWNFLTYGIVPFIAGFAILNLANQYASNLLWFCILIIGSIFVLIPATIRIYYKLVKALITLLHPLMPNVKFDRDKIYRWDNNGAR